MNIPYEKQKELIRRTMMLADEAAKVGDLPFAALLIDKDGTIIIAAKNSTNSTHNAAAHAEINMLFEAGRRLGTNNLSNYAVLSNAASCPMCTTALIKAKITKFYYGAPNEGTMVPDITMDEVIKRTPFPLAVHGEILAQECAKQITQLATANRH